MIGSHFNFYDLSQIQEIETPEVYDNSPVIISCFGADKGTEDMVALSGKDFISMYGEPNFKNYGQNSVQTRRVIDAGGIILGKRVVADDALLAHAIVTANLYQTSTQKTDTSGNKLYIGDDGELVTSEQDDEGGTREPAMEVTAHVSYSISSVSSGIKNIDYLKEVMKNGKKSETKNVGTEEKPVNVEVFSYPIFAITDIGRGVSAKRFRIVPENKLSKNLTYMYYTMSIIEDGEATEKITFTMVPDIVSGTKCLDLNTIAGANLKLAKAYQDEDNMSDFITKLSEFSEIDEDDLMENDLIFGTNRKGIKYSSIDVNLEDVDFTLVSGIELIGGSNGYFGTSPELEKTKTIAEESPVTVRERYYQQMEEFYDGTFTDEIYDLDSYQIDACFDACFPIELKEKILQLADYRNDFEFFRDFNLDCISMDVINNYREKLTRSIHAVDYCQAYDVIDPYSKKQITVSIMFSLAPMLTNHIRLNRNVPFAGQRNNAIIDEIITGTLNFKPRVTPLVNDKDELEDLRVNFGSYYKDDFTLETVYTSQEDYTQLSFANNVLAMQEVIKALRVYFPIKRYAYITSMQDLDAYTADINAMLDQFRSNFSELEFVYTGDQVHLDNKIYKAMLSYRFNNFIQAELVDAYALPTQMS